MAGASGADLFAQAGAPPRDEPIQTIQFQTKTGALPHFWEKAMGSDRTVVGLRQQWREDLVRARRDTGVQSVRCHGLFDDEMGIAAAGAGRRSSGAHSTRGNLSATVPEFPPRWSGRLRSSFSKESASPCVTEHGFEIVAGAQRYRAAQMAEIATVPVRIVNLTDVEALEAQLVELSMVGKSFLSLYATWHVVDM